MAVLNIPLLFEKGGYKKCDKTILVVTPKIIQKQRFIAREKNGPANSESVARKFIQISENQIDNYYKKKLADFIIYNGLSKGFTIKQTKKILNLLQTI